MGAGVRRLLHPEAKATAWKLVTLVSGTGAGLATEWALGQLWARSFDHEPPKDPADRRTPWPAALSWAVATGVGVGVARLVAHRSAAAVWEAATDEAPPTA